MISIEVVRSRERFAQLGAAWDELLGQSDMDCPFMTHAWFSYYWQAFCRTNSQPLIVLVSDNGRLAGIIPLVKKREFWRRLPVTSLGFMANYFSIRTGLISPGGPGSEELLTRAFRYLKEHGIGFDIFTADLIVKDSLTDRALRHAASGLKYRTMAGDVNPYVRITGSWDSYLQARSKHHRFNVRHALKKFEQGIDYTLTTYADSGLDQAAEKMFFISRSSWKFNNGTAICNDQEKMRFYREFLDVAANAGWLRFKILEINGIPAAFGYELQYKNNCYLLKIGYNNAFRQLSAGVFLVNWMLRQAFAEGRRDYELLGADEDWKQKMTTDQREHGKYWIFNDSPYGRLLRVWEDKIVAAARNFRARKSSPAGRTAPAPA